MNHPDENAASSGYDDVFASHFSFGMAVAAAVVYAKWRGPWGFSTPLLFCVLGLAALLLFGPIVVRRFRWSGSSYPIRLLSILVFILGLGWLEGYSAAVSHSRWVLASAGWMAWLAVTVRTGYAAWRMWLTSLVFLGIGVAFGAWTTLKCYVSFGYWSPLSLEMFEHGSLPHPDSLFFTATSNMIRFYGMPSMGLYGMPYVPYHNGVLVFFAWLSNVLETQTIVSFIVGMPLLVIPLCYGAMLRCALAVQRACGDPRVFSAVAAALMIVACTIGVVSPSANLALSVSHSELISESFAFGLFLLFSVTEITLCAMWRYVRSPDTGRSVLEYIGLGLLFFVLTGATTYSKGPVGLLYVCGFGFLLLRSGMWTRLPLSAMAGGAALGFATAFAFLKESTPSTFQAAHFFLTFVKTEWPTYFLVYYLWPICACVVLAQLAKRRGPGATPFHAIAEAIVFLVVVSMLPGLVFDLPSGNAVYFADVSVFVGLAALAAFAPVMLDPLPSGREWRRPLPAAWTLTLFLSVGFGVGASINALLTYREGVRQSVAQLGWLAKSGGITPMMGLLTKLRDLSVPDRSLVLVDIPSTRDEYWKAGACGSVPLAMPSFSGFAFLDGRPDVRCQAQGPLGHQFYPVRDIAKEDPNAPPCSKRPDKRFRYIVSLASAGHDWIVLDCQEASR